MNEKWKTWFDEHRLTIIVGHAGSGKTELAVNMAICCAQDGKKTAIADLDVVNPYFRSREREELLKENGIRLIATAKYLADADLPSMPIELNTLIDDKSYTGILDIGGDAAGARVLARYRPRLEADAAEMLFVVNANRHLTSTVSQAESYLRQIEAMTGLRVGGIVNNTHLCEETTAKDILFGAALAKTLSEKTGIALIGHVATRESEQELQHFGKEINDLIRIQIFMKKPWEL